MELFILNPNLQITNIVDTFESLIWTERYKTYGDFEIYSKVSSDLINILAVDNYAKLADSDRIMIIESSQIKTDVENGDKMIIKGRSAESILSRRIIWNQTSLNGNLQNGIQTLLNDNLISPTIPERQIPNFIFQASTDPTITALTVNAQYNKDNLYDAIANLCETNGIGFKVTLSDDNKFIFQLYSGVNRSYEQLINPYVVFSPEFDNILNSDYTQTKENMRNITFVEGEVKNGTRKNKIVGTASGISRREMYSDAGSISQTVNGTTLSDTEYYAQLTQKGNEDLASNSLQSLFDSQVDTTKTFQYGKDFFLGDIVQIVNGYGIGAKARISELIRSQNTSGVGIYPTFTIIN